MTIEELISALNDGGNALRYRAERLRLHSEYDEAKPFSANMVEKFKKHAEMLEGMAETIQKYPDTFALLLR